jgi:hypothetical protein
MKLIYIRWNKGIGKFANIPCDNGNDYCGNDKEAMVQRHGGMDDAKGEIIRIVIIVILYFIKSWWSISIFA